MSLYRDVAVVLRTYRLGEADRIVVLMTKERGKVRAVAKGVRRTKSKFGSRLEPGSYVDLQLYETRGELDIVSQVETIEPHRRTREDLSRLSRTAALLEAVDNVAQEGEPSPRVHDMLVGGLRAVEDQNPPLVTAAFYLKLLAQEGLAPEVEVCVGCAEEDVDFAWAPEAGGVRCGSCGGGRPMSDEALSVVRAILGGGLNVALSLPEGSLSHEVEALATTAFEQHVERRMRAPRVLHD